MIQKALLKKQNQEGLEFMLNNNNIYINCLTLTYNIKINNKDE